MSGEQTTLLLGNQQAPCPSCLGDWMLEGKGVAAAANCLIIYEYLKSFLLFSLLGAVGLPSLLPFCHPKSSELRVYSVVEHVGLDLKLPTF